MDSSDDASETESARSGGVMGEAGGGEDETMVFVALPEHYRSGRSTLAWSLRHIADMVPATADRGSIVVVIVHVHAPAQMIPVMGSKFHASKLRPEQVAAYRKYERDMMNTHLDKYIHQCSKFKIRSKKLVIENENVAKGITDMVSLHNVCRLVMGAAADKHYSRKIQVPKSKTAITVMQNADTSCNIWFVCKEYLICTREFGAINIPLSTLSECSAPPNRNAKFVDDGCIQRSASEKSPKVGRTSFPRVPCLSSIGRTLSKLSMEVSSMGSCGSVRKESLSSSYRDEPSSDFSSIEVPRDDASTILPSILADCHFTDSTPCHEKGDKDSSAALFDKLDEVLLDAQKHQKQVFQVSEHKAELQKPDIEHGGVVNDPEHKMAASRSLVGSHHLELEQKKHARNNSALKYGSEVRRGKENLALRLSMAWSTEYSLSELQQATKNFSDTMKIGEGGFGCVYGGVLRHKDVAIKILRSQNLQGQLQFQQEVAVLSRVRHPNLVALMGSCPEVSALVYEFLPNGSLEDRLACESSTPPLTWQVRTRIIGEICSALVFLHSNLPRPVIHGDLKPANILLDAKLGSKLGDFGVSSYLLSTCSTTSSCSVLPSTTETTPRGTFAYMDPEFLTTGELTPLSDVYSFGIVLLRLVTGLPPLGIARRVEDAMVKGETELLVDRSAGDWPFPQAEKLMLIGLECAELSRRRRPDRMSSVQSMVEPLVKAASLSVAGKGSLENRTPSYFICPISQEVMKHPHIAADGFTYEAEAIRGWLDSGHGTSPMTKLALAHRHLTPNYALDSAIEEYMKKKKQQQQQQIKPSSRQFDISRS